METTELTPEIIEQFVEDVELIVRRSICDAIGWEDENGWENFENSPEHFRIEDTLKILKHVYLKNEINGMFSE